MSPLLALFKAFEEHKRAKSIVPGMRVSVEGLEGTHEVIDRQDDWVQLDRYAVHASIVTILWS